MRQFLHMESAHLVFKELDRPPNTDCGERCLGMVINHYDVTVDWDEIHDFLRLRNGDSKGTFLTDLARFAIQKRLSASCLGYPLYLPTVSNSVPAQDLSLTEFQDILRQTTEEWQRLILRSLTNALSAGMGYVIKKPDIDDLRRFLSKSLPVVVGVNHVALYDRNGDPYLNHDIILTGYQDDRFFYIDPSFPGEKTISISDLLFAILQVRLVATSAYALAIGPATQ